MNIKGAFIYKLTFNIQNKEVKKLANEPNETHSLLLRRGLKENLPNLIESELVYVTDEKRLYVGTNNGNVALPQLSETEARYTKPADGIPESDLTVELQEKVNKGDVAEDNAKAYTDQKIDNLLDGASDQLDTLKELGDAIISGETAHAALINEVATKVKQTDFNDHLNDNSNPHNVTKEQIGLSNVDNTSDLDKPISAATQNAINNAISDTQILEFKVDMHINDSIAHLTIDEHNKLDSIEENANNYALPVAGNNILGGVKIGENITQEADGTIRIPDADNNTKGIVQLGDTYVSNSNQVAATTNLTKNLNDRLTVAEYESHLARTNSEDAIAESSNALTIARQIESDFWELVEDNTDAEILQSRGSYNKLYERLDAMDTSIVNIDVSDQIVNKVDKEEGKGLSTNDYTNDDKEFIDNTRTELTDARSSYSSLGERLDDLNNLINNVDLSAAVQESKDYTDGEAQKIRTEIENIQFTHISGGTF